MGVGENSAFSSTTRNLNLKKFGLKSEIMWYLHWNLSVMSKVLYLVLAQHCDVTLSLQSARTLKLKHFEYWIIICCVTLNQTFARLVGPYNLISLWYNRGKLRIDLWLSKYVKMLTTNFDMISWRSLYVSKKSLGWVSVILTEIQKLQLPFDGV